MENIVTNLVHLADTLDRKGLTKQAVVVDKVAANLSHIKLAQYVGIQGYWIRNSRCWSNCYRIKRAEKPSLSAQEVWRTCQNEYVDSLNNDATKWDKYAGDENDVITKFAEHQLDEKVKKIISAEARTFHREVSEKVAAGMDAPVAIYDTIAENVNKFSESIIQNSAELMKVSKQLPDVEGDTAKKLATVSEEIVREAQGFGSFFGDVGRGLKSVITRKPKGTAALENLLARFQKLIEEGSEIVQNAQNLSVTRTPVATPQATEPAAEPAAPVAASSTPYNIEKNAKATGYLDTDLMNYYQKVLQERAYLVTQINRAETGGGPVATMSGQLRGVVQAIDALVKAYPTMQRAARSGRPDIVATGMRRFVDIMSRVLTKIPIESRQRQQAQAPTPEPAPGVTAPTSDIRARANDKSDPLGIAANNFGLGASAVEAIIQAYLQTNA